MSQGKGFKVQFISVRENLVISEGKLVGFVDSTFSADCKLATHILGRT